MTSSARWPPASEVRRLLPADADALAALRREALESHPLAFGAAVEEDRALSRDFLLKILAEPEEQAVFGYAEAGSLAGMVGILRSPGRKRRHLAQIWGMYVAPRARNRGAGRALLGAALAQAREWPGITQVHLGVTDAAGPARRLYEAAGFRAWGREPRALFWQGSFADEIHMVFDLS